MWAAGCCRAVLPAASCACKSPQPHQSPVRRRSQSPPGVTITGAADRRNEADMSPAPHAAPHPSHSISAPFVAVAVARLATPHTITGLTPPPTLYYTLRLYVSSFPVAAFAGAGVQAGHPQQPCSPRSSLALRHLLHTVSQESWQAVAGMLRAPQFQNKFSDKG